MKNDLQNFCKIFFGSVLINFSTSNIFPTNLSPERFHLNCEALPL